MTVRIVREHGDVSSIDPSRNGGLDALRVLAAFAVVLIHTADPCGDGTARVARMLLPSPNALFAVLAGYLMVARPLEAPGPWLRRRAARLLVPYVAWSAVYIALNVLHDLLAHRPFTGFDSGRLCDVVFFGSAGVQMWFLVFLFYAQATLYAVLRATTWIVRVRDHRISVLVSMAVAVGCLVSFPRLAAGSPLRMLVFMLGFASLGAALRMAGIGPVLSGPRGGRALAAVALAAAAAVVGVLRPREAVWCGTLLWFCAGLCADRTVASRPVQTAGTASMGVYLSHVVFTTLLAMGLTIPRVRAALPGALCNSLVLGLVAFLLAWLTTVLLQRWRVTAVLVR